MLMVSSSGPIPGTALHDTLREGSVLIATLEPLVVELRRHYHEQQRHAHYRRSL